MHGRPGLRPGARLGSTALPQIPSSIKGPYFYRGETGGEGMGGNGRGGKGEQVAPPLFGRKLRLWSTVSGVGVCVFHMK